MTVPALVRGPHGMGVRLMRLATDALDYRPRDGGGNILTLTRSLAPPPTRRTDRWRCRRPSSSSTALPPVTVVTLNGELDGASYERVIDLVRDAYDGGDAEPGARH